MQIICIHYIILSTLLNLQGYCKNIIGQNKVVGGHPVQAVHAAPFIVSIQVYTGFGFSHGCAGTICGKKHVITAGHCLAGHNPWHILILVGTVELKEEHIHPHQGQFFRAEKFTIHEDYGPPENDIGIIKCILMELEDNIDESLFRPHCITKVRQPIYMKMIVKPHLSIDIHYISQFRLVLEILGEFNFECGKGGPKRIGMSLTETKEGTNCSIFGWGFLRTPYSHEYPIMPNTLRSAVIPITNYEKCKLQFMTMDMDNNVTYVTKGTICAGYAGGDKATCYGDSGGPLVCNTKLVGIVSFGSRKCGGTPGVFTSVLEHLPWIAKHGCTLCH